MVKTALVLLVGEQPVPNLLPTRHIKPQVAVLVHTRQTQNIADRLKNLLSECTCLLCCVDAYNLPQIQYDLQNLLEQNVAGYQLLFNLTGGTKPMSLAAFQVAFQRQAPFVYFRTEGGQSRLYYYRFVDQGIELTREEEISEVITLDDYLRAQVGDYTTDSPRDEFERQVYQVLRTIPGLEICTSVRPQKIEALEVDFVLRLGNQVGVMEAKAEAKKRGIDQIQAVTEQRFLGTYVTKFLVSGKPVDLNNKNLAKAYKINVIELTSYGETGRLSSEDARKLIKTIYDQLGHKSRQAGA